MDVQTLADIEAIRRLTCDYAFYWDTRDLDSYANCFVEDGVLDSRPSDENIPVVKGRSVIRAFAQSFVDQQLGHEGGGGSVHAQWNHRIDVDGDTASGTVYFWALGALERGGRTDWMGYYRDSYVRTPDGWKFSARVLHPLMPIASAGLDYAASSAAAR